MTPSRLTVRTQLYHRVRRCAKPRTVEAARADLRYLPAEIKRDDLHLQWAVGVIVTLRHVLDDGVEQRMHIAAAHVIGKAGVPGQARRIDDGKIQLLVGSAQLVEQIERRIDGVIRTGARTVD